jgi:hypothetical protein
VLKVSKRTKSAAILVMSDVCIVCGGSNDVSSNESNLGIHALKQIVSFLNQTNFIVINVPHRHDLSPNSCVNHKVYEFNRRLEKLKKTFLNFSVVLLVTRHGFHLNCNKCSSSYKLFTHHK